MTPDKPLPRRAVLKALAALPAVIEQAEQAALGATVGTADAGAIDAALGSAPMPMPMMLPHGKGAELLMLAKSGMLPDRFKRAVARQSRYYYGGGALDPDVACLRSVALGAKLAITARRREERAIANFGRDLLDQEMHAKFMGWGRPQ